MIDQTSSTKVENVIPNLSDLVAATFLPVVRQGGCVTYVDSSSNEKRRIPACPPVYDVRTGTYSGRKPAVTTACNKESLNLGLNIKPLLDT